MITTTGPQAPLFKASDYPDSVEPCPKLTDQQVAHIEALAREIGRQRVKLARVFNTGSDDEKRKCQNALADAYQELHNYLTGRTTP